MPLPSLIQRLMSFTAFQQSQGDNSFPGTGLDTDLDQTNDTLNDLISAVAAVLRADGKIANGAVGRNALAADLLVGVGPSKPWAASNSYKANADTVTRANKVYLAVRDSVGVDPATDTTSAYWLQTADLSQSIIVAAGSLTGAAFADGAIPEAKLANGAASSRVLADGSVTRAKAALNLGVVPVGAVMDYSGVGQPLGWLLCTGLPVSRTTYADLFNALSLTFTATTTTSSSTLTAPSQTISGLGLRGAAVEGPGIPAGTILVDDSALTLSNPATASATVTIRVLPYGRGDGSTTFNLPDLRGRVTAGRDDMGGGASGRLVTPFNGASLAGVGGGTTVTLSNAQLPAALPGGSVTVSYPPHQYVTHASYATPSVGAGGTPAPNVWQGDAGTNTVAPGAQTFGVSNSNPGGGQPFNIVQPTGITNKIIFAGV